MIAFALAQKPLSYNTKAGSGLKAAYALLLRDAFMEANDAGAAVRPPFYGIAYHFHRSDDRTDADNISKSIWDALRGAAYEDDAAIRLRVAGKLQIGDQPLRRLDLTRVPASASDRLARLIGRQRIEHILYVELGALRDAMFPFGLKG